MAMTREEFAGFVKPAQLQFINDCIRRGLADYADLGNYSAYARLAHTSSVRAQIRNCHIVYHAEHIARERPDLGIQPAMKGMRQLFYINGKARLSLKKLNEEHRHHNYPTLQALAFDAQLWPDELLEETGAASATAMPLWTADIMPPITNVVGGYVANKAETEFEIYVICPNGEGNAWEWQLTPADIVELMAAHEPAATDAAKKIRQRRLPITVRPGAMRKQVSDDTSR